MDKLFIIIPAFNESANIELTVLQWHSVAVKYGSEASKLVIVNDGSTDDTLSKLCKLKKSYSRLVVLNKKNGGHGSAVLHGYRYAIKNKADYIFQTDSDGQTLPSEFGKFWARRNRCDAVIGRRLKRGDGFSRKIVEDVVCLILFVIFGIKVRDANAPFRLMKTELVDKYIRRLPKNYNIPNIMFTTFFVYYGESVEFLPITFKPRRGGKNKLNYKKIAVIGARALSDFAGFRKDMKNHGGKRYADANV
ncbi:MAG: glycosyltransferase family 2 protein [Ruminococcus sp.]|nr:glycosyltransferase family 2 protein [Ruminococcus sp.]